MNEKITHEEMIKLLKTYESFHFSAAQQHDWFLTDPMQIDMHFESVSIGEYYPQYISFKGDSCSLTISMVEEIYKQGDNITFICDALFREEPESITIQCA